MRKAPLHTSLSAMILAASFLAGNAMANIPSATVIEIPAQTYPISQEWDKVFPQSDAVSHRKVTFTNRYGITLVGDLYVPKNAQGKLAAIAVAGPFGAVKEQVSGLYAQRMAERGFVTLAFDPSYTGESAGLPRNLASPEINTEDFSAAVDFLGSLENVERDRIGILGVCGWGGFALNAAIADTRIKAVATSTMYDMARVMAKGYNDSIDENARYDMKQTLNNLRWEAAKNGHSDLGAPVLPAVADLNAETPQFLADYVNFYKTERGFHPRSVGSNLAWTSTTPLALINMPILHYASELRTPTLIVHGENAHSRYFSEDAFKALGHKENKTLHIVAGASHVDLYDDRADKIPYDTFTQFFNAHLQ